jgi:hypothetical protein
MDILRIVLAIFLPPLAVFLTSWFGTSFLDQHSPYHSGCCAWNDPCPLGYYKEERKVISNGCILENQQWRCNNGVVSCAAWEKFAKGKGP